MELETYFQRINQRRPDHHLLAGDFNAVAPGDYLEREGLTIKERLMLWWEGGRIYHDVITSILARGYIDCFRALHPKEDGFTLPAPASHVRLDYIFADRLMYNHLRECYVVTTPAVALHASDHYPVLAVFEM